MSITDSGSEEIPSSSPETTEKKEAPSSKDWLLEHFAMNCTVFEGSVDVTIVMHGAVITGTLIGMEEYFREFAQVVSSNLGPDGDPGGMTRKSFEDIGTKSAQNLKDDYENDPASALGSLTYFHMKNARFVHGRALIPTIGGLLWRGKLKEVDGFSLGGLTTKSEESNPLA